MRAVGGKGPLVLEVKMTGKFSIAQRGDLPFLGTLPAGGRPYVASCFSVAV